MQRILSNQRNSLPRTVPHTLRASGDCNASLRAKWQTPDPPYESLSVETDMNGGNGPTTLRKPIGEDAQIENEKAAHQNPSVVRKDGRFRGRKQIRLTKVSRIGGRQHRIWFSAEAAVRRSRVPVAAHRCPMPVAAHRCLVPAEAHTCPVPAEARSAAATNICRARRIRRGLAPCAPSRTCTACSRCRSAAAPNIRTLSRRLRPLRNR